MARWGKVCTNRAAGTLPSILPSHHVAVEFGILTSLQLTSFWSFQKEKKLSSIFITASTGASRSVVLFVQLNRKVQLFQQTESR